ncbi:MAG: hypothetical protein IIC13_08715 [SAR324 cluster bacterium]|nr:hypothetical protein [SAR324 cluster bacterium]MCH8886655.1 hypothetical protein [SAR324 cluster bacterium]
MARRILSADAVLTPAAQSPLRNEPGAGPSSTGRPSVKNALQTSVRTENPSGGLVSGLESRWHLFRPSAGKVLFDWEDRRELFTEIEFVNQVRERMDEAAVKIAPSMLRIVLTVKANVEGAKAQRAFLAEHVDWDFRRISELCIAAESYGLLDAQRRTRGEQELRRYGWSNALKLAYVPDPLEREEIWDRARGSSEKASYRAVLEEIKRFRERKLVSLPSPLEEVGAQIASARGHFDSLGTLSADLSTPDNCRLALKELARTQRELSVLRRALKERMDAAETEALAATV